MDTDWSKVLVGTEIERVDGYHTNMRRTFLGVEGSRIDYVIHFRSGDVICACNHVRSFKPKYKVLIEV